MARIYNDIVETIGRTPVVKIRRLAPEGVDLYVKVEAFNPLGSIKDRLAMGVIEEAERSGQLQPGQTVVEATSGNTGIGLAMVCAARGYPLVVVMPENFSVERRKIMRFLGAKVVLTPAPLRGAGMLTKAKELADEHGWFLCRQFENEANADVHSRTTAREILDDFDGRRLDYWVTGFGTGGTLKGVARVLGKERPETRIVVCEPDNSPILQSGVPQSRGDDGSPADSHPKFRTHLVQGWSPDFIPKLADDASAASMIDDFVTIDSGEAVRLSQELARKEGIFVGISAGATFAGALEIARNAPPGSSILCMLPDTAERYLSTPLFDDVPVEMTDDELAISTSTPSSRFDVCSVPGADAPLPPVTPEAEAFVADTIASREQPVVMFALEWCEFCWSVRKLFKAMEIEYRSVDLDSVEYQEDERGGRIHAALQARVAARTVPQIFVGGTHVGGCTETLDAFGSGELQSLLAKAGVAHDESLSVDPYSFMPKWLHPR